MEVDGADGAGSEDKVSEVVKAVRTCQNSFGRNGTCLGLLLLLVGPNGDKFGGQAFMEHYISHMSPSEMSHISQVIFIRPVTWGDKLTEMVHNGTILCS
jgi:hypothetical protein